MQQLSQNKVKEMLPAITKPLHSTYPSRRAQFEGDESILKVSLVLFTSQHKSTYFWKGLILWNNIAYNQNTKVDTKNEPPLSISLIKSIPFKRFLVTGQLENFLCRKRCILDCTVCFFLFQTPELFSCLTFFSLHPSIWLSVYNHCNLAGLLWTINCEHSSSHHVWRYPGLQWPRLYLPVVLMLSNSGI